MVAVVLADVAVVLADVAAVAANGMAAVDDTDAGGLTVSSTTAVVEHDAADAAVEGDVVEELHEAIACFSSHAAAA